MRTCCFKSSRLTQVERPDKDKIIFAAQHILLVQVADDTSDALLDFLTCLPS